MAKFPLDVSLMDDDPLALHLNYSLLTRDLRTRCSFAVETPEELKAKLTSTKPKAKKRAWEEPDVFVLDAEYASGKPSLGDLISFVRRQVPAAKIICLSQYGNPLVVRAAMGAGASGFLMKSEIKFCTAAAVVRACYKPFVFTPGLQPILRDGFQDALYKADILRPCTFKLTPRQRKVIELCLINGMSAAQVANDWDLETETIEKYRKLAYHALDNGQPDEQDWEGIDLVSVKSEDRAFMRFTALKR